MNQVLARRALWALRAGYAAELVLLALTTLVWPGPGREPSVVIAVLLLLPLLLFLPALWRGVVRTQVWLCFLILLYFAAAVTEWFIPARRAWATAEIVICCWVFIAGMCYIRWGARSARDSALAIQRRTGEGIDE